MFNCILHIIISDQSVINYFSLQETLQSMVSSSIDTYEYQWSKHPGSEWAAAADRLRPQVNAGVLDQRSFMRVQEAFRIVGEGLAV